MLAEEIKLESVLVSEEKTLDETIKFKSWLTVAQIEIPFNWKICMLVEEIRLESVLVSFLCTQRKDVRLDNQNYILLISRLTEAQFEIPFS